MQGQLALFEGGRDERSDEVERTDSLPSESTPLQLARSSSIAEDSVQEQKLYTLVDV